VGEHRKQRPAPKRAYEPKRRKVVTSHRAVPQRPGARRAQTPPKLRPRYGRIAALGAAACVTSIAVAGLIGVIPGADDVSHQTLKHATAAQAATVTAAESTPASEPTATVQEPSAVPTPESSPTPKAQPAARTVPANSGQGRRVVFSIKKQRVWLVNSNGQVKDSYLVSGSVTDNLDPGSYEVYSRSRYAVGIDDSGEMEFFVRFTRGDRAAIGFHSIPTKNGEPLQSVSQLGTPQSHGCIRQKRSDAITMWDFAPDGTKVVVTA
jgi:lipoprotein-anchoring transpeptidase ErfK/SrfK